MSTFVLIPGAGGNAGYWNRLGAELEARRHEVVAVDIEQDDPALGLREYADIVDRAIDNRPDVVLVAQSLGGFTAPMVRSPLRMIVLLNAMIPLPGEKAGAWWDNTGSDAARRALARAAGYDEEFDLETYFLHDLDDIARAALFASQPRNTSDTAFEQPCDFVEWPAVPIKVLVGRDDRFFPADFQLRIAKERLGLEGELITGGHLAAVSYPGPLADRLDEFARTG
jgi:pimeloyl-ACP methyl ester carboxylesterase